MSRRSDEKPVDTIQKTTQQAAKSEMAPARVQWYRSVVFRVTFVSIIVAFATLAFLARTTPSFAIDLQITRAIQSIDFPFFAGFMRLISWAGFSPQSVLITLLIGFTFYIYGFKWESLTAMLAAFISSLANETVKYIIHRPRPTADLVDVFTVLTSYSFPSGHVMFYVSLFGFVWYLAYTLLQRSWTRSLLLVFFGALISLVGVSRIYLGQHWASDVLGAYLLGSLVLIGAIFLHQWGKDRFFRKGPKSKKE
jgi:membrane-associated phospholipid phosphatase